MENTTATPEVEFSDRMKETIAENLNEVLTPVDNDTMLTPNGDRYVGLSSALKALQCSKTHFYMDICRKNTIRQKHLRKRVYFSEIDLVKVANDSKASSSSQNSIDPENNQNSEKREARANMQVALVNGALEDKKELKEQVALLLVKKEKLYGWVMFLIACSTLFVLVLIGSLIYFSLDKSFYRLENKSLNERINQYEQNLNAKIAENNVLNIKLAVLQAKGDQK